jgi:CRP-like cAMP-binding protein
MQDQPRPPNENNILSRLPPEDYERIAHDLVPVELQHGKVIQEAGEPIEYVYFPLNSMVSLISQTPSGESVEVGIVGYEGVAGISAVLGVDESPHEGLVQIADGALRMSVQALREEFKRAGKFHDMLLRYTQSLLLHTSQVAACNRLHSVSERLARWLLMSDDRCDCDDLPFTQEFLSLMLGVRRASVTEAALVLHAESYINYRRGHIQIIDRAGLLDFTCDCYDVVKTEFDLLVGSHG